MLFILHANHSWFLETAAAPPYQNIFGLVPDDVLPPIRVQHVPQDSVSHIRCHQASTAPPVFLEKAQAHQTVSIPRQHLDGAVAIAFPPRHYGCSVHMDQENNAPQIFGGTGRCTGKAR